MLVEDDLAVAKGFQVILEEAGYNVVAVAHDGVEAVEQAAKLSPDLILMDIKMPRLDGIEAARQINRDRVKDMIPVVLVTAFTEQHLVARARECGVLGYLVKPVQLDDLVPAVEMAYNVAGKLNALEGALENLSRELESRKYIERAKGILMRRLSVGEEEAMALLQKEARRQRMKLRDLAKAIISSDSVMP